MRWRDRWVSSVSRYHINNIWNHSILLNIFTSVEIAFIKFSRYVMLIFTEIGIDPYFDSSFSINPHHLWPNSKVPIFPIQFLEPLEHTTQYINYLILLNFVDLVESYRYSFNKYSCILATPAKTHTFFQVDISTVDNRLLIFSLAERCQIFLILLVWLEQNTVLLDLLMCQNVLVDLVGSMQRGYSFGSIEGEQLPLLLRKRQK